MQLFHKIEGAIAIVRGKGGVHKQVDMYARGERVFIPHSGGYIRVCAKFGSEWGTANPDVKVLEFEGDGISDNRGEPRYVGLPKLRAV